MGAGRKDAMSEIAALRQAWRAAPTERNNMKTKTYKVLILIRETIGLIRRRREVEASSPEEAKKIAEKEHVEPGRNVEDIQITGVVE